MDARPLSQVLYLYGFVPRGTSSPPESLRGVAAAGVDLLDLGEVSAAVSSVPADAFAPETLEERVHDLAWVGEQGALHERVVTWFVDHGGVLPARLLTLYTGADALRASLAGRAGEVAERLSRLRGLREWDLKVSYDGAVLADHLGELSSEIASLDEELAASSPGRRYLLERKRQQLLKTEVSRAARGLAGEVLEGLLALASEDRRLPLPGGQGELPVVLNAALLLASDREAEARSRVEREQERLRPLGLEVHFTGPWAPYRFLGEEEVSNRG